MAGDTLDLWSALWRPSTHNGVFTTMINNTDSTHSVDVIIAERKTLEYKRLLAEWAYHRAAMREISCVMRIEHGRDFPDPFPVDVGHKNR